MLAIAIAEAYKKHGSVQKRALRDFGLIMATAFTVFAFLPVLRSTGACKTSLLWGTLFFAGFGLGRPALLKPLYQSWMLLGGALGFVNTRIILGVIYFVLFTPISLVLRLLGKDILSLRYAKERSSYFVRPTVLTDKSFKRQF